MAWTYDVTALAGSPMMQVRLLVGDTTPSDQLVQDEEIGFLLSLRPSIYGAAANVCRSIAAKFSREADTVDKDLRTVLSARSRAYATRANDYEIKAVTRSGALPYAGGLLYSDKGAVASNPDRVPPGFAVDMDVNYLPVGPVGNESGASGIFMDDAESDNV